MQYADPLWLRCSASFLANSKFNLSVLYEVTNTATRDQGSQAQGLVVNPPDFHNHFLCCSGRRSSTVLDGYILFCLLPQGLRGSRSRHA